MKQPTTSWSSWASSAAATEESTPPDIATSTFCGMAKRTSGGSDAADRGPERGGSPTVRGAHTSTRSHRPRKKNAMKSTPRRASSPHRPYHTPVRPQPSHHPK